MANENIYQFNHVLGGFAMLFSTTKKVGKVNGFYNNTKWCGIDPQ